MDRQIQYPNAQATDTDVLASQKNAMVGLAHLTRAVLGSATTVDGLACTPGTGLNAAVAPGSIYSLIETDATAYGSLGIDTSHIVKQGLSGSITTLAVPAPGTAGQSINYLVEAQYQDVDGGDLALAYYDSANPAVPYTGPGNTGEEQPTVRQGICALQVKAGTAATTGTQTTPAADAGWTPLWVVTIANGAVSVITGNIVQSPLAPFVPSKLPLIPAAVQNQAFSYGVDTGSVNAIVVATTPPAQALVAGQRVSTKVGHTNTSTTVTLNRDGLGAEPATAGGSGPPIGSLVAGQIVDFEYDGTEWQVTSLLAGQAPGGLAGGDLTGSYPSPTIAAGAVVSSKIAANAVTNALLAAMAAGTVKANITGSTAAATDVSYAALLAALGVVIPTYAQFQNQQSSGSPSGESWGATTWSPRALVVVVANNIAGASLSGSQVTLPAGVYRASAQAFAQKFDGAGSLLHKLRIRDVTHSVTLVDGVHSGILGYSGTTVIGTNSQADGFFTLSATATIEVDSYTSSAATGGAADSSGDPEVYVNLCLTKFG